MYSKNDYRYYLEHHMITGDYLAHYGVEGMHWGVRRYQPYSTVPRKSGEGGKETGLARKRSKLEQKKASNEVKIEKYKKKLQNPKIQAKKLKARQYEASNQRLEASGKIRKAKKAQRKDNITVRQDRQLAKYEKNNVKVAKLNRKADILQTKIDTLEYKNAKLDQKLKNIDVQEEINRLKKVRDYQIQNAHINQFVYTRDKDGNWDGKYVGTDKEAIKRANAEYKANVKKAKRDPNSTKPDYSKDLKELEALEKDDWYTDDFERNVLGTKRR